jgi:alkyl sulfatase BDS1-like metallo-beta-lactamase superfamily hydrolase
VRWALELASMLATSTNAEDDDRKTLAHVLRTIATRTTSANIRNWCLTRARQWDGSADGSRLTTHRFSRGALLAGSADNAVHVLRVLVDPSAIDGIDAHVAFDFAEHGTSGLHVRNNVCVPTNGDSAQHVISCSMATWAGLLTGSTTLTAALASKDVVIRGDESLVTRVLRAFDPQGFRS